MTKNECDALTLLYRRWRVTEGTILSLGVKPETIDNLEKQGLAKRTSVNNVPCVEITPKGASTKLEVTEDINVDAVIDEKPSKKPLEAIEDVQSVVDHNTTEAVVEPSEPVVEREIIIPDTDDTGNELASKILEEATEPPINPVKNKPVTTKKPKAPTKKKSTTTSKNKENDE